MFLLEKKLSDCCLTTLIQQNEKKNSCYLQSTGWSFENQISQNYKEKQNQQETKMANKKVNKQPIPKNNII